MVGIQPNVTISAAPETHRDAAWLVMQSGRSLPFAALVTHAAPCMPRRENIGQACKATIDMSPKNWAVLSTSLEIISGYQPHTPAAVITTMSWSGTLVFW
jgi:hypothetical protein